LLVVVSTSKQRIEEVTAGLLARRGYSGMGLKAVSESAGLPYGSIYHHFPGGKEQIAADSITQIGQVLGQLLEALFAPGVNKTTLGAMFDFMAHRLETSDWTEGCSVGTPAQDGSSESEPVRLACKEALDLMVGAIAKSLVAMGLKKAAAHDLAMTILSTYEGATILARTQRSRAPLDAACKAMVRLVDSASG
jgi:TetR/AcrR family transcriptional repressor of lmrAB and yxaGH operons